MLYNKVVKAHSKNVLNENKVLEGAARVLGHKARYQMFCTKAGGKEEYKFCVAYRGERSACSAFCNRQTANKIFFSLLRGRVTPCSATYIIKELADDGENSVFVET